MECFTIDSGSLSSQSVGLATTSLQSYLTESTLLCRLLISVPLYLPEGQPVSTSFSSVEEFFNNSSTIFCVSSKPPLIFSESTTSGTAVRRLIKAKPQDPVATLPSSSQHIPHAQTGPVIIELLRDHTQPTDTPSLTVSNPLPNNCLKVSLSVDVLVLANITSPLRELAAVCREKLTTHLKSIAKGITWKEGSVCTVTTHHLALWNQHCPVTIVYPHTAHSWESLDNPLPVTTDDLRLYREELHKRLCLGTDLPYLRVPRQPTKQGSPWLTSNIMLSTGSQLLNPHHHLKQTVKTGSLATVQGDYLYYHYMQNGFNDNGWGCAYRSLQTLWSWFWLQGYTDKPPPTHKEIQESVVAAKTRSSSLIGSKEWIGSIEVSNSLNQLLGLVSIIKPQIKGPDMASVGRVLLEHFRTHGTPVMIGGGVLAHTILGVTFNDTTGETQFLILDPHYTGTEDINTITAKGKWCGWKKVSFWDEKASYNLCMPKKPTDFLL
ncbi:ufm1-specific protease 2-like isoform X2 [Halichondria panicea]